MCWGSLHRYNFCVRKFIKRRKLKLERRNINKFYQLLGNFRIMTFRKVQSQGDVTADSSTSRGATWMSMMFNEEILTSTWTKRGIWAENLYPPLQNPVFRKIISQTFSVGLRFCMSTWKTFKIADIQKREGSLPFSDHIHWPMDSTSLETWDNFIFRCITSPRSHSQNEKFISGLQMASSVKMNSTSEPVVGIRR